MVERLLCRRLSALVDCSRYLKALANRQLMASGVITRMMTKITPVVVTADRARALAVALTDLLHFAETCLPEDADARVYLAVALDNDMFVIGLGVEGDVGPVATAEGSRSLQRAATIVRLLGGEFQRGMEGGDRVVFGLTFSPSFVECER